jgi:phenylalanyl-tRNA synthetase alpha chain
MKEQLEAIRKNALNSISATEAGADLEALRVKYLGKKGELTAVLKQMGSLSQEMRPVMGQKANEVRAALEEAIAQQSAVLEKRAMEAQLKREELDVTIPGKKPSIGHKHPMYTVLDEIKDIFIGMGFEILDGPEVELSEYNFTKLNTPEDHPAREWSDTFYLTEDGNILLRTQTSNMQIRAMETRQLPIRMLPRPGLPQGRGGRHALPHVPSDRGHGGGQGHHHGRPEGHAERRDPPDLRRGHRHPVPSPPLPVHRALLRDGHSMPQVRR